MGRRLFRVPAMGRWPRRLLPAMAVGIGLLASACSTGAYPFDLFHEMHYNQSYKSQEPPRLDAPRDSVPVSAPQPIRSGQELYLINCSICHGPNMWGDGPVLKRMQESYAYEPLLDPDLTSQAVQGQTDVQLTALISAGVSVMPSFRKLLTTEEIQRVVAYVREQAAAQPPGPRPTPTIPRPTPTPGPAPVDTPALEGVLAISSAGDNLEFDKKRLTVQAGADVVVRFKNSAKTVQHNWVLVKAGTKDAVAAAGSTAGPSNDWVPPKDERVIASTKLVDPGKTGELRFTAPAAGTYQYVCTFPGHNVTMFGTLEVKP